VQIKGNLQMIVAANSRYYISFLSTRRYRKTKCYRQMPIHHELMSILACHMCRANCPIITGKGYRSPSASLLAKGSNS